MLLRAPLVGRRLGDVKHVSREVRIVPSLEPSHPYFLQCECRYDVVVTASECHLPSLIAVISILPFSQERIPLPPLLLRLRFAFKAARVSGKVRRLGVPTEFLFPSGCVH